VFVQIDCFCFISNETKDDHSVFNVPFTSLNFISKQTGEDLRAVRFGCGDGAYIPNLLFIDINVLFCVDFGYIFWSL